MTTDSPVVRYADVSVTSRIRHEGEAQLGRGGQTASTRGSAATRGQEPTGSSTHGRCPAPDRIPLARGAGSQRHRRPARDEQRWAASANRRRGIIAAVRDAARGRHGTRLLHAAVDAQAGRAIDRAGVRRAIQRGPRLALARAAGAVQPETRSTRPGTRRCGHRPVAQAHLASAKKTPLAKEG